MTESTPPATVTTTTKKAEEPQPAMNPVEAAGRRLERLYGGGRSTTSNSTNDDAAKPSAPGAISVGKSINPPKILKKWLGSSSGTAGAATLADVAHAAFVLLDPRGSCATGRDILVGLCSEEERRKAAVVSPPNDAADGAKNAASGKDDVKMDVDPPAAATSSENYLIASPREAESWLLSLAVRIQWRASLFVEAYQLSEKALMVLDAHLKECQIDNSTTVMVGGASTTEKGFAGLLAGPGGLYPLQARLLRYRSLTMESLTDVAQKTGLIAEKRVELATRHRMACLRRDADVSSTVMNLMLRDLLNADQVEQAQKLLSNSTFPNETATNNQLLRYLYYSGRIQALRLEYTSSFSNLSQCLRKSPTHTALGFRIAVQRLLVVVQLLMGEIPDRAVFFAEGMKGELKPYLEIAQAVRRGDLAVFHSTVGRHADRLRLDGTFTLISRLAHSVVKAGLRRLKTSYSRISLEDVAVRLSLPSATSAEFVVAKAVRDGVIDATIDHEKGYVQSHDLVDVYATVEPSEAFHRRIAYCLTTHNDAVRGMRYPPDAYKKQLEASRGLRGRKGEDKTDEEKAQELEDDFDEDY
mmetsp:Transcript_23916/g.49515  ORF Transcript_23916/g.49515 Transcript_23916/m.49515 type:complete len:584 (-) Transcript_23916:226-1977(-)